MQRLNASPVIPDYTPLYRQLAGTAAAPWLGALPSQVENAFSRSHGHLQEWLDVLGALPIISPSSVDLNCGAVRAGEPGDCSADQQAEIKNLLLRLHPWRKGPYLIHGIHIDTEWRSDWKWERLAPHIAPLSGRRVLDVGCGNGYHCWRMQGAELALGIDPTLISVMQFHAVRHFLGERPVWVLPLGIEQVPPNLQAFDTVFSMGVLYHRRSPLDHLLELRGCLRPGGQLVLETLVIEGGPGEVLVPEGRYARMRNVWFIPSCATLESWLRRCGYRHPRTADVSPTLPQEQRRTDWMRFESLAEQLDPADPSLTVEGLPAPRRAVILAEA